MHREGQRETGRKLGAGGREGGTGKAQAKAAIVGESGRQPPARPVIRAVILCLVACQPEA